MTGSLHPRLKFLLLQLRDADDPMRTQELRCFHEALPCEPHQLDVFDLTHGRALTERTLRASDIVLIGGSGNYSVVEQGDWWPAAEAAMQQLYDRSVPTFASCWGFQALAQSLGGEVVTDPERAELGTITVRLTSAAAADPVFATTRATFDVQQGHQDIVDRLPDGAVCLASSDRVTNQALTFPGKPIYATQFHPELRRVHLLDRVRAYPQYIERIAEMSLEEFVDHCRDTPDAVELLRRFVRMVAG